MWNQMSYIVFKKGLILKMIPDVDTEGSFWDVLSPMNAKIEKVIFFSELRLSLSWVKQFTHFISSQAAQLQTNAVMFQFLLY